MACVSVSAHGGLYSQSYVVAREGVVHLALNAAFDASILSGDFDDGLAYGGVF